VQSAADGVGIGVAVAEIEDISIFADAGANSASLMSIEWLVGFELI